MRSHLLAALLGAALLGGCGGSTVTGLSGSDQNQPAPVAQAADVTLDERQFLVPPAPEGAGTETFRNETFGFSIQFSAQDFALFTPPEYVTVLGNRVFELVLRELPAGEIFRPNVGMITDPRFRGQPIEALEYVNGGLGILEAFFETFELVGQPTVFSLEGQEAVTIEYLATWRAPNGTLVPLRRTTLFVKHLGEFLIFTFTTPPAIFENHRATFQAMVNSIDLFPVAVQPVALQAALQGSEEVPPVATGASGTASIAVNPEAQTITVSLQTQGLTDVTGAHIHIGEVGVNGPIIFTLYTAATDGPFPATLERTLTPDNLEPRPESGINTFAEAVSAILNGSTYVNVHTQVNPGGEIRGQIVR